MPFELREYQKRCLAELQKYLRRASDIGDPEKAFNEMGRSKYRSVEEIPGIPYVCVRVPTGGGKTVLAANAVAIAAFDFLNCERALVLWLAPTKQIVAQTLGALRNKQHPYRQALDTAFDGCVSIFDLKAALAIPRSAIESDTCIIVTTIAALRVEDTEGRKVYDVNGQLQEHFVGSAVEPTLANLLSIRHPILIVDEAHNARTSLSFDTLARFSPSCILEFTATPAQDIKSKASNVLTDVSAAELKAEDMIKLPIRLVAFPQWTEAVQAAIAKQEELERLAEQDRRATGEYIRPIVLFQAQRKSKDEQVISHELLKAALIADHGIPPGQIAVATGDIDDLADIDVLDPSTPIRFIITVDKLREGWDCPFAYILCSVSNLSSKTAVEQILGRILRLPFAKKRIIPDLNQAYAFATSQDLIAAASSLRDALVESGYEKFEVSRMIETRQGTFIDDSGFFAQSFTETITEKPDLKKLPQELQTKVRLNDHGAVSTLTYTGTEMPEIEKRELLSIFAGVKDKEAVERIYRKSHGLSVAAADMRKPFQVPQIGIRVNGELELLEDQFRDVKWDPKSDDALLSESEFAGDSGAVESGEVDVDRDGHFRIQSRIRVLQQELTALRTRGPKTTAELVMWLDRTIPHPELTQQESTLFFLRLVEGLLERRSMSIEKLVANQYRLKDAAVLKLREYHARLTSQKFQELLLAESDSYLEVSPEICFSFPFEEYPAPKFYEGPIRFTRHYYQGRPAEMNGEEAACASILDELPIVEYWVRNLERDKYAFWLPTPTDKFYPDFVAKLLDGRFLVVEYKGEMLLATPDTKQKQTIGELWESRSNGRCLFRLVSKRDMGAILRSITE